ncbi:MAG TPA: glycoside hydrolase family 2 TIM barrel-domain containing protein [Fibrobacteria bacterium]|nr:glycoside hydrolase family 2 TIM barrel-domain containing protein [Fibrobacteria bacterium]
MKRPPAPEPRTPLALRRRFPFLRRLARWAPGGAGLALALACAGGLLLSRDPHPGLEASLPASCGAKGDDFEIRCLDGMPYLFENGLPYPTGFDSTDLPRQSLNGPWRLRFDAPGSDRDPAWPRGEWHDAGIPIDVPSTYNAPGGPYRGHQGPVWFARRFRARPAPADAWIRLCFQGVLLRCRVWLNGVPLGDREGGYTPFYFDVDRLLKPDGDNVLVVRADNRLTYASLPPRVRPKHNPVWGVYGGIYRDVYLETLPAVYLGQARVSAYRDSSGAGFAVQATIHGAGPSGAGPAGTLTASVRGPGSEGTPPSVLALGAGDTQVLRFRLPVAHPRAWGPGRPESYSVDLALRGPRGSQSASIVTGFRDLTVADASLRMDGKALFLKGISKMEDDPASGQTQTPGMMRRDLGLIRDMGANYVRLAHYPHHEAEARLARDMGLMVGEEIAYFHVGEGWSQWMVDFQGWAGFPFSSFGLKQMHRKDLLLHAQKSLIELIERDGGNPAVILWSLGNESYSLNDRAGRVYAWLRESARAFDPSRPVSMAEMTYYLPMLDARRSSPRFLDVASVNMYYGWYFGEAEGAGDHLDRFHARYPGKAVLLSEFGAEAALGRTDASGFRTGDRVFFPRTYSEEYQASLLEAHVRTALARPYVLGVSPWVFADFYCPWFPRNPVPDYNTKGVVTRERAPKLGYFALQKLYRELPDFRAP